MTGPLRRAEDRCRHCGRDGIDAHQPWCPQTPDDPLPDEPAFDPERCARAEDDYQAMLMDGHR